MKFNKLNVSALFLMSSFTAYYAQEVKRDTVKKETQLEGVIIRGNVKKSDESNLINLQKKSAEIIETVGAEQLSKQGVSDVATAVTKATGTIKQEGSKTISVRGLLDRYNTSTLNGLPIPSDDPENKNIDLAILKTDMIDYLAIEKVFAPRLSGDFGGANINIVSKEYRGKPYAKISLSSSVNTQIFDTDKFLLQQGPNFWGFQTTPTPSRTLDVYQVKNSWNFKDTFEGRNFTPLNSGLDLEGGKTFKIGSTRLSAYFYGGFGNDYSYAEGIEGNYNSDGQKLNRFNIDRYNYTTNTTGLVNLFYRINSNHRLKAISNYIHSTGQDVRIGQGYNYDWATDDNAYIRRAEYVVTDLIVNQLGGEHKLNRKLNLNWIAGYNIMDSKRPDRITNILLYDANLDYYKVKRDGGSSNRYFDNLKDNELSGNLDLNYELNDKLKFTVGYQGRYKTRDFNSRQYDFRYNDEYATQSFTVNPEDLDYVFNQQRFDQGFFQIRTNYQGFGGTNDLSPMTFNGKQYINSGFGNADYKFSDRLTAQLGVRFDHIIQDMEWETNFTFPTGITSADYTYDKILPSLNLKYALNDLQNLRFSASRTYTLPQMKEMAPYIYANVSESTIGNVYLKPSDNNNVDLKWEYFPKRGEIIAVTGYGKYIQNPISKAIVGEGLYSYLNVGNWAYVWGLEAEFRKDLLDTANGGKLYTFINASYLNSKTQLDSEKILKDTQNTFSSPFNATEEKLQEAADLIGNANIGYNYEWNKNTVDFVVSYSYVGENLYAVSTQNLGNIVQKSINKLDAILKFEFSNNINFGISAKNLLNPNIKRVQMTGENPDQNSITYQYKKGREFGISMGYKF